MLTELATHYGPAVFSDAVASLLELPSEQIARAARPQLVTLK
jgi:hypothetical protein